MLEMFYFRHLIRHLNSYSSRKASRSRVSLADLKTAMLGTSVILSNVIDFTSY